MRPVPPVLRPRMRRANAPLRYPVEAHTIVRASIKQTQADWLAGDGPPSGSDFEFVADGGLRIAPSISALISSTSGSSFFTDLNNEFPYSAGLIIWGGTDDPQTEIMRVKANLHPNRDGSGRQVVWWKCQLFHVSYVYGNFVNQVLHPPYLVLTPLCPPVLQRALGDAAGEVTFDFSSQAVRPKPKALGPARYEGIRTALSDDPATIVLFSALKADGSAAGNVGWGYDNTITSFGTGNILKAATLVNQYTALGTTKTVRSGTYGWDLTGGDGINGGSVGVPKLTIETGAFTAKTITFSSGNLLDLGGAPTGPVHLAGLADTPPGTSVTYRIRNDADSAYVEYVDGQTFSDLGLTATQTRKVQATLTPNAAGSLTPTLRKLGMEEKTIRDLSHVAHIVKYKSHVDPVTLEGRITTATLRAVKNGIADFRSAIEDLLTAHDLANLEFRWYAAATNLARQHWMLIDAFVVVDDVEPGDAAVGLELLGANALISARLPKYDLSGSGVAAPDSTVTNPGSWTDQAGGSADIHTRIDENPSDDTDYAQSPLSPSNAAVEFGLANLADPNRDTGHFVDFRLRKDATGGEVLSLVVELRQAAVVKMLSDPITVPDEWTDFSLALTAAQAQSISDYTDLRVRLIATVVSGSGTRRVQVSWVQWRITGHRSAVVYTNQPADEVYADLLDQAEVPTRYQGPGILDTLAVSKTIADGNAIDEARALGFVFGKSIISTRGAIHAVDYFDNRAPVVHFAADAVTPLRVTPGFRERRPTVSLRWNWDEANQRFIDEAVWQSTVALTKLGPARVDAEEKISDESGKWVYDATQAKEIVKRTGQALATGLMLWRYRSRDPFPELECADPVTVGTRRFLAKDPHSARALRGDLVALARLTDVTFDNGFWEYTGWLTHGYADIYAAGAEIYIHSIGPKPRIVELEPNVSQTGVATAKVKVEAGKSIRVAAAAGSAPSDATVRAAALVTLDTQGVGVTGTLVTLTASQKGVLRAFAYEKSDGAGAESLAAETEITHYEGGVAASVIEKSRTAYQLTAQLFASDLDGDQVRIKWRTSLVSAPLSDYTSGDAGTANPPGDTGLQTQPHATTRTVDRGISDRFLDVWAEDANGNKSAIERILVPAVASADLEAATSSFVATPAFVGTCPTSDLVDTLSWNEAVGVPAAWRVDLFVCETALCDPPTSGPFESDAQSTHPRTALTGVEAGVASTYNRKYRIRMFNSYGELVDDDVDIERTTNYQSC